jgi:8-oxo-dGTP pyrophosphatase MutT (NUDIX family)
VPVRQSVGGLALIGREVNGRYLFLAQWNAKWQAFHFVGGHRQPGESFRACVSREVAEELGLREGDEFVVAEQPRVHLEYTAWSESARAETAYAVEVFAVELTATALQKIEEDPTNQWLTVAEVHDGRCADGGRVSPTMALVLSQLQLQDVPR